MSRQPQTHPGHAVAARQMSGFGGMLSFDLAVPAASARAEAARVVEALSMIRLLPTLGGIETSVMIPSISSILAPASMPSRHRARGTIPTTRVSSMTTLCAARTLSVGSTGITQPA